MPAKLAHRAPGSPCMAATEETYAGTQLEMPHHANVVVVDISSAIIVSRRVRGFAKSSTRVNRASCREASSSRSPRFCAAVTSRRRASDSVQLADSTRPRRIHQVASAGSTPITYIQRHAEGPRALMKNHTPDAQKNPMPSPHCISPAPLPRCSAGHISATIDVPVPHSAPSARPTMKRRATNDRQELLKGETGCEDQGVRLVSIEQPAEIGDGQCVPLSPVEHAIPGHSRSIDFLREPRVGQGSLQFAAQYPPLYEIQALFVVVACDDEQILFGLVKTIQPIQLGDERVFIFLNPGCVFSSYVPDSVHMPCGVTDQKVFSAGTQDDIDHLRPRSMSRRFDEHHARSKRQILLIVDDVVAACRFRCELDFRHLRVLQQRLDLVAGQDRL